MKKFTLIVLLIAIVVCLTGCSQKKIDELTATFNTEKEALQAQITEAQESLKSVTDAKDALIAEGQEKLEAAQAEAKEKRVRVELSRNREMPRPDSKIFVEILFSRRQRSASATAKTAAISSSVFSQVRKKSPSYILLKSSLFSLSINCCVL